MEQTIHSGSCAVYAEDPQCERKAIELGRKLGVPFLGVREAKSDREAQEQASGTFLVVSSNGLFLEADHVRMAGDFSRLLPRIRPALLRSELSVKASGMNKCRKDGPLRAIDATAGMGEDAFLLAAAGFFVTMYEKDPVIAALLRDAMERAAQDERLAPIVARMTLEETDSIEAMKRMAEQNDAERLMSRGDVYRPADVILLDPMFPERRKSALVKKKFQILHVLEKPCEEERELLQAAMCVQPGRILIKRPLKGPWLAGVKPSFSLTGKAIRFDCLLPPYQLPEDQKDECKKVSDKQGVSDPTGQM